MSHLPLRVATIDQHSAQNTVVEMVHFPPILNLRVSGNSIPLPQAGGVLPQLPNERIVLADGAVEQQEGEALEHARQQEGVCLESGRVAKG